MYPRRMTIHRPFRFGAHAHKATTGREWLDLARKIEDLGYSSMFVSDHYLDRNLPDVAVMHVAPIAAMAAAATVTSTLRIGCRVFCVDYHVPAALAKEAATIDLLSDGRLEFGIGAGWSPVEYESMGLQFGAAPDRVRKLEEVVALLKAHWSGEVMQIDGEHVKVSGYAGLPLPVQKPHPPLMIGGGKKRVLSLAAREGDIVSISNVPFLAVNDDGLTPMQEAARRLSYVTGAAGDRIGAIDIESSPYRTVVTSDVDAAIEKVAKHLRCAPEVVVDHPNVLIGSPEQMAETLLRRREVTGVNYVTVPQSMIDDFAPVAALLHGK